MECWRAGVRHETVIVIAIGEL